ncbi:Nif3-like dinuclear metal center hexameric protein, partial [Burkholderia pseudomallei]
NTLGRAPLVIGARDHKLRPVAWCTCGAQSFYDAAIEAGADVFMTGEESEHVTHAAAESGEAFDAAGHHPTERFGIQPL